MHTTPELIVSNFQNNNLTSQLIKPEDKQEMSSLLERVINEEIKNSRLRIVKDGFVDALLDEGILYSNFLKSYNFNNILFVSHFNAGQQLTWSKDKDNFNLTALFHFIPLLIDKWEASSNIFVTQSKERRFSFIMKQLYDRSLFNIVKTNKQYCFGKEVLIENFFSDENNEIILYDAVVFLDTPNIITPASRIKTHWSQYCTDDYELIHLSSKGSELTGAKENIEEKIQLVVTHKKECDSEIRGVSTKYENLLRKTISVY